MMEATSGIGQSVKFEVIPMMIRSAASLGGQDAGFFCRRENTEILESGIRVI